jgi:acetolactate synthase-1/3 small subunit
MEKIGHTISALVEDNPGVLARVAGLFRRRGFNISSLAVGKSEQKGLSRMTFVIQGDSDMVEQVTKQLYKLIEVVRVTEMEQENMVARELALMKIKSTNATRNEIMQIVDIFRAGIVDVGRNNMIVEITGDEQKVNSFIQLLQPFGIGEIMRTGQVAMMRGAATSKNTANEPIATEKSAADTDLVE